MSDLINAEGLISGGDSIRVDKNSQYAAVVDVMQIFGVDRKLKQII